MTNFYGTKVTSLVNIYIYIYITPTWLKYCTVLHPLLECWNPPVSYFLSRWVTRGNWHIKTTHVNYDFSLKFLGFSFSRSFFFSLWPFLLSFCPSQTSSRSPENQRRQDRYFLEKKRGKSRWENQRRIKYLSAKSQGSSSVQGGCADYCPLFVKPFSFCL